MYEKDMKTCSAAGIECLRQNDKIIIRTADQTCLAEHTVRLCLALSVCSTAEIPASIFTRPFFKQLRWDTAGNLQEYQHSPEQLPHWPMEVFVPCVFRKDRSIPFSPHLFGVDALLNPTVHGFDFSSDLRLLLDRGVLQVQATRSQWTLAISDDLRFNILLITQESERHDVCHEIWNLCLEAIPDPFSEPLWLFQFDSLGPFLRTDLFPNLLLFTSTNEATWQSSLARSLYAYCSVMSNDLLWISNLLEAALVHTLKPSQELQRAKSYIDIELDLFQATLAGSSHQHTSTGTGLPDVVNQHMRALIFDHPPYGHHAILNLCRCLNAAGDHTFSNEFKEAIVAKVTEWLDAQNASHLDSFLRVSLDANERLEEEDLLNVTRTDSVFKHDQYSRQTLVKASSMVLNISFYQCELMSFTNAIRTLRLTWSFFSKILYPGVHLWLVTSSTIIQALNATGNENEAIRLVFQTLLTLLSDHFLHQIRGAKLVTVLECFSQIPLSRDISSDSWKWFESLEISGVPATAPTSSDRPTPLIGSGGFIPFSRQLGTGLCDICRSRREVFSHCSLCQKDVCLVCLGLPHMFESRDSTDSSTYDSVVSALQHDYEGNEGGNRPDEELGVNTKDCADANLRMLQNFKIMVADSYIGGADYLSAEKILTSVLNSSRAASEPDESSYLAALRLNKVLRRQNTTVFDNQRHLDAVRILLDPFDTISAAVWPFTLDEIEAITYQYFDRTDYDNGIQQSLRNLDNDLRGPRRCEHQVLNSKEVFDQHKIRARIESLGHLLNSHIYDRFSEKPASTDTEEESIGRGPSEDVLPLEYRARPEAEWSWITEKGPREQLGTHTETIDELTDRNTEQVTLHSVIREGKEAAVALLLDRGADIEARDENQWTPLHYAAWNGHKAIVALLLGRGADIEARDQYQWTPLHYAAYNGHEAIVALLLDRKADIEAGDEYQRTPLHRVAYEGREAIVTLLLDRGADIEARDKDHWTPLHYAAIEGCEAIVVLLLDRGADIEARDKDQFTPLHRAVYRGRRGHKAMITLLLDRGADIDVRDKDQSTPLHHAIDRGYEAMIVLLLDRGADIEARDKTRATPLHQAAYNGNEAIVALLLDRGADIEARDEDQLTPLYYAVLLQREAIATLLLKKGADPNAKTVSGVTVIRVARQASANMDMIRLLRRYGAEESWTDKLEIAFKKLR